ncbi:hypothetical protein G6F56_010090 [Rhizopus delemar]|nr:hypothetical protein G6F56_010090 [Rhizopus delemar]
MSWLPKKISRIAIVFGLILFLFLWYLPQQQQQQQQQPVIKSSKKEAHQDDHHYTHPDPTSPMVVVTSASQLVSFYPLLCRFKHYPIHLALLGADLNQQRTEQVLAETDCPFAENIQVHQPDIKSLEKMIKDTSLLIRAQEEHSILDRLIP